MQDEFGMPVVKEFLVKSLNYQSLGISPLSVESALGRVADLLSEHWNCGSKRKELLIFSSFYHIF